jgi:hypothetical protein
MICLDHQLIYAAQRFVTGANVHDVSGMIYRYELAVQLHNTSECQTEYKSASEAELRKFVRTMQQGLFLPSCGVGEAVSNVPEKETPCRISCARKDGLSRISIEARKHARELRELLRELEQQSQLLDTAIAAILQGEKVSR